MRRCLDAVRTRVRTRRRRSRDARGTAAFEFALIAPVMLLLCMGTVDFGYMLMKASLVNNVARDGARVASLGGSYSEVSSTVTTELTAAGIPAAKVTTLITCTNRVGSSCTGASTSYDTNATSGSTVVVTISYTHGWVTPMGALCSLVSGDACVGNTIVIRRAASMVRE